MKNKKQVMFICSVGGHLTQMLQMKDLILSYNYILITDKTPVSLKLKDKYNIEYMKYCSRKYKFSYYFIEAYNVMLAIKYLIKYNPKVIVTTGTHTAMPTLVIGKWLKKKIIYIESFAKNKTPTRSALYAYKHNVCDDLIIQWEGLKDVFPNAKYWGGIY